MGRRPKISYELKLQAVKEYLNGESSSIELARKLSVDDKNIFFWVNTFKSQGATGLQTQSKNKSYSRSLKQACVQDYLSGNGSLEDIRVKYGVKSNAQLRQWIKKYNGHEEIKSTYSGGTPMAKGRKTTLDERVDVVKYCIEHDKDYVGTSNKFGVSYQQARNWTLKYESKGLEGLTDRRGKSKPVEELSEVEKLKAELKILEAQNKRLEMENIVLKKLKEIERRWD